MKINPGDCDNDRQPEINWNIVIYSTNLHFLVARRWRDYKSLHVDI